MTLFQKSFVACGSINRIQILPLKILDQGELQHLLLGEFSDDYGGNLFPSQLFCRHKSSLSGNQFELLPQLPYHHRLNNPLFLYGGTKLGKLFLIYACAGLIRIRFDLIDP